jgi:ATP-dependent Clp protease ATP-binding subunit ClpB
MILFDRLSRTDMDAIVKIQLGRLAKRLEPRKIELDLTDEAVTWIADKGYDPVYGARPLKRVIQKALQDPLAELLLAGSIKDGEKIVVGSTEEDGLVFGDLAPSSAQDTAATVH